MNTPPLLRGGLYPSQLCSRCPRFHPCTVTKKCNNFDQHQPDCQMCESLVRPPVHVGGYTPEGEFVPDLQDAMAILSRARRTPVAHPDMEAQPVDSIQITNTYERERKAADLLAAYSSLGAMDMYEETKEAAAEYERLYGAPAPIGRIE